MSIAEQTIKAIPIVYSITLAGTIFYKLPCQVKFKENNWLVLSLGLIFVGSILDLAIVNRSHSVFILRPLLLVYLGSALLIKVLLRIIRTLFNSAYQDSLTEAYNRRALYYSIENQIKKSRKANDTFTLVFIDIDNFKTINDDYGHIAGDAMLKDVCATIKNNIRKEDLLFRYGGDEFVLLVPGSDKKETGQLMKRLESLQSINSRGILRFSYGLASYPEDGDSPDGLLRLADLEMYCRKAEKIR
ncbi:MAG: GGDEF domain-containing protein [Bacillota bacterium]